MKIEQLQHVAVVGAGSMGHGIAEVCALAGYSVKLQDVAREALDKGHSNILWSLGKLAEKGVVTAEDAAKAGGRVTPALELASAVEQADLVIEAATERMAIKKDLFATLDRLAPPHAVLASNTSSLSITELGRATRRPGNVVGLHFFNPPVLMKLVEVIKGEDTSEETMAFALALVSRLGKTALRVNKDVRSFVVNRMFFGPYLREAAWIVSRGEASIEQVDSRMKFHEGFPMGPFELQDLTGADIGYYLMKEAGQSIPPIIEEKVSRGELGRKTGKGYYDYRGAGVQYSREAGQAFDPMPIYAVIANEAAWLIENQVSTPEDIDRGIQLGAGFPDSILRRFDRIGIDKLAMTLNRLRQQYGSERYQPVALLEQMAGAGKRFYDTADYQTIRTELDRERGIGWITLNRPERLNAINRQMREELPQALSAWTSDESVRVVVIRGAGDKAFCAGADITEFGKAKPFEFVDSNEFFLAPAAFPKPVIAAIDGYCFGGGMELALACDFRLASRRSQLGQPEVKIGLMPGAGGTQRLARMLGPSRAKELCMIGDPVTAEQALQWGMVDRVFDNHEFEDKVAEFATKLAASAPIAVRMVKRVIDEGADLPLSAALMLERAAFGLLFSTEDMREGTTAFLEKRKAQFKGR
jgi:enoyl-CoA hydratase/3-hydroxyacyl-CoA dehydrogenase